jgi:2-polyprenyl-3-methyl-5-hydroxy-6-metoxy-1,4-benzoquinol methylase
VASIARHCSASERGIRILCDFLTIYGVLVKEGRRSPALRHAAGSAFEVDFGGPYDAVLLTNFLHHFDQPACVDLLKKVHGALRPGGRAATLEFVPNEDRVSPPMPAAFSMTMLTSTAAGDAYTLSELTAMYHQASEASRRTPFQ